jgi:hypothetical protein
VDNSGLSKCPASLKFQQKMMGLNIEVCMHKATKAALISAFIFPGCGTFI